MRTRIVRSSIEEVKPALDTKIQVRVREVQATRGVRWSRIYEPLVDVDLTALGRERERAGVGHGSGRRTEIVDLRSNHARRHGSSIGGGGLEGDEEREAFLLNGTRKGREKGTPARIRWPLKGPVCVYLYVCGNKVSKPITKKSNSKWREGRDGASAKG